METLLRPARDLCEPQVLSLPMRNGNPLDMIDELLHRLVLSLPMRNGNTRFESRRLPAAAGFLAYL